MRENNLILMKRTIIIKIKLAKLMKYTQILSRSQTDQNK